MTKFNIDVISDTVCPWCYVGKQKLDKAIKAYQQKNPNSQNEFNITWKPFYLNPAAPLEGQDKNDFYISKFGAERTKFMHARLMEIGAQNGIAFKYGGRTGNTRNSHRLLTLARSKSPALQTRVVEELFSMYFENEGDITSFAQLTQAGVKAGLDEKEVSEWLASDRGGKEVDEDVLEARRRGISGVPNFTVNGKFEVGGAQESEVFEELFEKIARAQVTTAKA